MNEIVPKQEGPQAFSLAPRNLEEAFKLADMLAESEFIPKDYRGKPANVLVAVQWGAEIGLKPLQALQNLAVINGRPSLWGDALIALVRASPLCEYIYESWDSAGTAICQVKRRGEAEETRTFSDADAKLAGLMGKTGPWTTNPKRMKQMRARGFALRDKFADVIKGIAQTEDLIDLPREEFTPTPLAQIAGLAPAIPPDLLNAGKEAASKGSEAYQAWWSSISKEDRKLAQYEHQGWKQEALSKDVIKSGDSNQQESTDGS